MSIQLRSLFLITVFLWTGLSKEDAIEWVSDHELEWKDFKGVPHSSSEHSAYTSYDILLKMEVSSIGWADLQVNCVFKPSRSWVKNEAKDSNRLLDHEQLHFDIGECSARSLRKELTGLNVSFSALSEEVTAVKDSLMNSWRKIQESYDAETEHGTKMYSQLEWEMRIDSTLESLSAYQETRFRVSLRSE